jgi:hypothetical protein
MPLYRTLVIRSDRREGVGGRVFWDREMSAGGGVALTVGIVSKASNDKKGQIPFRIWTIQLDLMFIFI